MGKKLKYLATFLVAISTALSATSLVSCSDGEQNLIEPENPVVEGVILTSIEITSLPNKTTFYIGDSFRYSGLEVTAYYDDGTTKVVTDYTVAEPDLTTAGEKEVVVSYTEGSVTVTDSYTITVLANEISSITIDSSWSLQIAMEVTSIIPTVIATYGTGVTATLPTSEYTVSITDADGTAVTSGYIQGDTTYTVTVALIADTSVTDSKTYTTSSSDILTFEAEDAEASGFVQLQPGHSHGYFSSSMGLAYTSDGSSLAGSEGVLTFTIYAFEGNYDLSFNVGSMLCYNTSAESSADYGLGNMSPYDQIANPVNDTVTLEVNGTEVSIPDTAVFTQTSSPGSLATFLNNFSEVNLTNIELENGENTITLNFGASKSGVTNRWGNPPSFNVDYIKLSKTETVPEEKVISSISVERTPWVTTYNVGDTLDLRNLLLKVDYTDGTSGYVANNYTTSDINFESNGTQNITVTYQGFTTNFEITVLLDPISISIDPNYALNSGSSVASVAPTVYLNYENDIQEALDSSEVTYQVLNAAGNEVTEGYIELNTQYTIVATYGEFTDTLVVTSTNYYVMEAEDGTVQGTSQINNNGTSTYVTFDIKATSDPIYGIVTVTLNNVVGGTYNLSSNMFNGNIQVDNGRNYDIQEMNLSSVVQIYVNMDTPVSVEGKTLSAMENTYGANNSWRYEEFKQSVDFGNIELVEGTNTLTFIVTYNAEQLNRWSAILLDVDNFIFTPVE